MQPRIRIFNNTDSWEYGHESRAEEQPLDLPKKRRAATATCVAVCFLAGSGVAALADATTTSSTDGATASTTTTTTDGAQAPAVAPSDATAPASDAPASAAPTSAPAASDAIAPAQAASSQQTAQATPTAPVSSQLLAHSATPDSSSWKIAARTRAVRARAQHAASTGAWVAIRPASEKARSSNRSVNNAWVAAGRAQRRTARAGRLAVPGSRHNAIQLLPRLPVLDVGPWLFDRPAGPIGAAAVTLAERLIGTPYVWGGASPYTGFDCSGLTQFIYAQFGIPLPHYAAAQWNVGRRISPGQLEPGDLVFFEPKFDGPGHVGIYIGNDEFIAAPHTGAVVSVGSLSEVAAAIGFVGAVRPYSTDALARSAVARLANAHRKRHLQEKESRDGSRIFVA